MAHFMLWTIGGLCGLVGLTTWTLSGSDATDPAQAAPPLVLGPPLALEPTRSATTADVAVDLSDDHMPPRRVPVELADAAHPPRIPAPTDAAVGYGARRAWPQREPGALGGPKPTTTAEARPRNAGRLEPSVPPRTRELSAPGASAPMPGDGGWLADEPPPRAMAAAEP